MIKVVDSYDTSKVELIVTDTALEPCPFCGSEGVIVRYMPNYYSPKCSTCPVEIHEHYFTTRDAAIAWNTRQT